MSDDEPAQDDFVVRLDAIDAALDESVSKALALARELFAEYPDEPEALAALVEALRQNELLDEARRLLEDRVTRDPNDAEARYLLGMAHAEGGDTARAAECFLEVRELDRAEDERDGLAWREYEALIIAAAENTIASLPPRFREPLKAVPILLEDRPSEELVRDGFDPRALGLFEGRTDEQTRNNEIAEQPTRIVLYAANLVSACETEDEIQDEVEITVLHELGHYYGLEEEELAQLGWE